RYFSSSYLLWFFRFHNYRLLERNVSAWIFFKSVLATFRPVVQTTDVDNYLSFGVQFDMSSIHWTRRRSFEVDAFTIVATAVTRTLEFVFTGFPVRRAAEVRATRVDHEQSIRSFSYPDSILLLPLRINPERVVTWWADAEHAGWFKN